MGLKKESPLPVRLTADEKVQVGRIAEETGLTASMIIRLLIGALVTHYKENGNSFSLPLKWQALIAEHHKRD